MPTSAEPTRVVHDRALPGMSWGRELLDEYRIPEHLHSGLIDYLVDRYRPGGFLSAVLQNDLEAAVLRADPASQVALSALVWFLVFECSAKAHGSSSIVDAWCSDPRRASIAPIYDASARTTRGNA